MKSNVHKMTEEITRALGPIFHKTPEYDVILPAMCMCMARVIQSTPDRGQELDVLEDAYEEIKHALTQFLAIENEKEAAKAKLDTGIVSFSEFARQPNQNNKNASCQSDQQNQESEKDLEGS